MSGRPSLVNKTTDSTLALVPPVKDGKVLTDQFYNATDFLKISGSVAKKLKLSKL